MPPQWDGTPRFPERRLEPLEVAYTESERRAHHALREYTELRQRALTDDAEKFATEFVLKLLKKRLFSSPAAFATTLEQHERSLRERLETLVVNNRQTVAGHLASPSGRDRRRVRG